MRKMNPKNQMVALVFFTLFAGVLLTVMALGAGAAHQIQNHNAGHKVIVKQIQDVKPVSAVPLETADCGSLSNVPMPKPIKFKEVIECQIVDGVKHFSNYFVQIDDDNQEVV